MPSEFPHDLAEKAIDNPGSRERDQLDGPRLAWLETDCRARCDVEAVSARGDSVEGQRGVRFREVTLVPLGGTRTVYGFQGKVMGKL